MRFYELQARNAQHCFSFFLSFFLITWRMRELFASWRAATNAQLAGKMRQGKRASNGNTQEDIMVLS
jgi:hypothetical protein